MLFLTPAVETCDDNSGRQFAFMFLETQPSDTDMTLLVSNVNAETAVIEVFPPANPNLDIGGRYSYEVPPMTSRGIPIPAALKTSGGTGRSNLGFNVASTQPVTIHGVNNNTGSCGGFMALPIERLGYEYVAVGYWSSGDGTGDTITELGVVATEDDDDTEVVIELKPGAASRVEFEGQVYVSDGGNNLIRVVLSRYETLQIQAADASSDLTGARVYATRPVAVFSGNVQVDIFGSAADHIVEQLLPVGASGQVFNLLTVPGRVGERYRVIALQPNTNVFTGVSDAVSQAFLQNVGDVYTNSILTNTQVRADKEVLLVQYSVGQFSEPEFRGEPAMLTATPESNYKNVHTFSVPPSDAPADVYTYVTLTTQAADQATLASIYLDGDLIPLSAWNVVSSIGGNHFGAVIGVGAGLHRAYSSDPAVRFGAAVYGFVEEGCGFAYPAGMCLEYTLQVSNPLF